MAGDHSDMKVDRNSTKVEKGKDSNSHTTHTPSTNTPTTAAPAISTTTTTPPLTGNISSHEENFYQTAIDFQPFIK